jgi:hypothetical protein
LPQCLHRRHVPKGGVGVDAATVDVGVEHKPNLSMPTDSPDRRTPLSTTGIRQLQASRGAGRAAATVNPDRRRPRPRRWRHRLPLGRPARCGRACGFADVAGCGAAGPVRWRRDTGDVRVLAGRETTSPHQDPQQVAGPTTLPRQLPWRSPHGRHWLVDHTGTHRLTSGEAA